MAQIDIARVVDEQRISRFHVMVVGMSFLLMVADGYDNISIAYVAPLLIQEWGVDKSALGPLFGVGLLGGLFGPPIFGYLGDRYGRKLTVIGGAFFFGLLTLAQVWADSLHSMMTLRFIAGIGIGGVLPITIAFNAEFAPKRVRATMIMLSFVGVAIGGALGGVVASQFMGTYGWQVVFWSGGFAPMLIGLAALVYLPESIKFLSLRPERREELVALLLRIDRNLRIPADALFILSDESNRTRIAFRDIFAGRLAVVTPLYWAVNVISLLVFFFVNQWTPVLLTSAGMPAERAAMGTILVMLGGFVGALATMRPVDKFGFTPVPILFAVGIPAVSLIGVSGLAEATVMALVFLSGFCLVALQFGIVATETQIYPTYIRSVGVGSCVAFGRVGSVLGPLLGGALLARNVTVQDLFYVAGGLLAIGLVAAMALTPLYRKRMREMSSGDSVAWDPDRTVPRAASPIPVRMP